MSDKNNVSFSYMADGNPHIDLTLHRMPINTVNLVRAMTAACIAYQQIEGELMVWYVTNVEVKDGDLLVVMDGIVKAPEVLSE